ncbi:AAA family ATPase [uncultured Microbacterium sp.]|uniref:ATP-dependent DNA helicase n=1 Tax=uncultured Microbacterium sp. TaxID=191216 RepID=UPI0028E69A2C|nr:AAA family ATPase [uncultured Microbacterium sp.]
MNLSALDRGRAQAASTRIVIDEAGMLDQDLAHALITIADKTGAGVALIGDRAQLPAVGRGGVLDLAVAASRRPIDLAEVHRFTDKEYAKLTIAMRDRHEPGRLERGNITIHATDAEAWTAISTDVVRKAEAGATIAVAVTSNDAATQLNSLAQDARARAGHTRTPAVEVAGSDGLAIRVGDRIMTRSNNKDLRVANRDTWTVTRVHRDGSVTVKEHGRKARLPAEYVEAHTHLAYASTEYGVQGATVDFGHGIVTDSSSAQAVYVSATRGREHNTLHLVAGDVDEARSIFTGALRRESGDRGVEAARENITRDLHGIVLPAPGVDLRVRAERLATSERVYAARVREWELATANWEKRHPGISATDPAAGAAALEREHQVAIADVARLEHDKQAAVVDAHATSWERDYAAVDQACVAAVDAPVFRRRSTQEAHENARRDFTAKYGHEPTPQPPEQLRDTWRRTATAPGRDERLEAARRHVNETRQKLEHLQRDPAPTRPTAPTPGTPAQERAKDVQFLQARKQVEQRRGNSPDLRGPRTPTRGLER